MTLNLFPIGLIQFLMTLIIHSSVSRIDEVNITLQNQFDLVVAINTLHVGTKLPSYKFGQNNLVAINSVFSPTRDKSSLLLGTPN